MGETNAGSAVTRRQRLALLIVSPSILAVLALATLEGWRWYRPQSALFSTPFAYSLADAIERDDVSRAHAFIHAGQNPNEPILVRHPVVTKGQPMRVSPLVWAVSLKSTQSVMMLLGFGARTDRAPDNNVACLAEALGNGELAELLRRYGDDPAPECPEAALAAPPIASFLRN